MATVTEAIQVLADARRRFALDDERFLSARDALALLYRRAGEPESAAELYAITGICEHLRPVEQHLRQAGALPYSCGRPWSSHCHLWVWFELVLDCEGLMAELALDACVRIHDHRGTHSGSERGLVCTVHDDAVMGPHPFDARERLRG